MNRRSLGSLAIAFLLIGGCASSGEQVPPAATEESLGPAVAPTAAPIARIEPERFVTINGDRKYAAWWVVAEFHPFTADVRGIPVRKIRKNWCKATEFRKDLIPKKLLFEGGVDAMEASKLSFALEGHFDGSPTKQVALVGVYEECSGQKGRFLLILDQPPSGPPKVRFVDDVLTANQFGALSLGKDNSITEWACMDCDNMAVLKWDPQKHRFAWLPDSDGE
jgi:hypothetical protein